MKGRSFPVEARSEKRTLRTDPDLAACLQAGRIRARSLRPSVDGQGTSHEQSDTQGGQNGAVDVKRLAPGACQEVTVRTSFAPIRIAIPDGAGYTVNARTSFGKVHTDVPVESKGTLSGEDLSGKIGNGRCKMTLTNNNGNIELVKGK